MARDYRVQREDVSLFIHHILLTVSDSVNEMLLVRSAGIYGSIAGVLGENVCECVSLCVERIWKTYRYMLYKPVTL